jgi:predicted phage-related endonuclease
MASISNGYHNGHVATLEPPSPATTSAEEIYTLADGTQLTRDEWLLERRVDWGLGASDLHKIITRPVKLWYEMKGQVDADAGGCEQARWGRILEPHILDRFCQETGKVIVQRQLMLRHPDHSWLFVTIDALTLDGDVVEAKALSNFGNDDEDGFGWKPESPPLKWQIQAQQSMAITGEDQIHFPVFYGPELSYKYCVIKRDGAFWSELFKVAQAFRQSLIDDVPPTDFHPDDAAMISKLHRGKVDGPVLELSDAKLLDAVKLYVTHSDLSEREKTKERAKAAILQALGTSTQATIAGYQLVRKSTAKQTRLEVIPPPENA